VTIVALIFISSTVLILADAPSVSAQAGSNGVRVNPITGEPYGDISQYQWPQISGGAWAGSSMDDETSQHASTGPGPNAGNILWSIGLSGNYGEIEEIFGEEPQDRLSDLGYVARGNIDLAIGGVVFIRSTKGTLTGYTTPFFFSAGGNPRFDLGDDVDYVNALDPNTGALKYQIVNPGSGAPAAVDPDGEYFRLSRSGGWNIYRTTTGQNVWNVTPAPSGTWLPNLGISVDTENLENSSVRVLRAWDHSAALLDPNGGSQRSAFNDDELWRTQTQAPLSYLCADTDHGVLFYGSWYDRTVWAFNATDGTVMWTHDSRAVSRNALYYDGMFIHHGLQRTVTAFDVFTGEILWEWEGGERTYFGNSGCTGDGLFFAQAIDTPTGWTGCWNIYTGELLWRIQTFIYIGYFSPAYADGKIYCILADGSGVGGDEYETYNYWADKGADYRGEFSACIDALTGEIIWSMPFEIAHGTGTGSGGFTSEIYIAYGNIYIERFNALYCIGDKEAQDWSNFRGFPDQNAVTSTPGPTNLKEPRWSFKTAGPVSASPAMADGKVYIGSLDKNIYCLDAYTGEKVWEFTTQYKVQSSVAIDGGRVFTGTDDGTVYCLDGDTGDLVWSRNIGGTWEGSIEFYHPSASNQPRSSPIIVGNRMYVGSIDGKVYCLDTGTGNIVWSYQTLGPVLGSPAYHNDVVYITSTDVNYGSNGRLFAFDASDGDIVWAREVPSTGGRGYNAGTPSIATGIAGVGDILLIGNTGGVYGTKYIYGFNLTTGEFAKFNDGTTNYRISGGGSAAVWAPAYCNNVVYSSSNLRARASNASDGTSLWETWMVHNTQGSPLVSASMSGTYVYQTSDAGIISCFDANTGIVETQFIGLGLGSSSPAIWEGKLYVGHGNHYVYCFDDSPTIPLYIYAEGDKAAAEMWSNETLTIKGRLHATKLYDFPEVPEAGTAMIELYYYPGIPDRTVKVVFVRPDLSDVQVTATTDDRGFFEAQFSPDVTGEWSYTAYYEGEVFHADAYRYSQAYSEYTSFVVVDPPAAGGNGNGGEEPPLPPPDDGIPVEYIYVAVAVIVIVIVAFVAYFLLRKK
jgi:outer membrane protein assembly factor BamB